MKHILSTEQAAHIIHAMETLQDIPSTELEIIDSRLHFVTAVYSAEDQDLFNDEINEAVKIPRWDARYAFNLLEEAGRNIRDLRKKIETLVDELQDSCERVSKEVSCTSKLLTKEQQKIISSIILAE